MWGAHFCMGAYKRNVVVVIKMGAYIHGVLIIPILQYVCRFASGHLPIIKLNEQI